MSHEPLRILIVEDEEMVRVNLEDFLEDEGFEIESASSGEAGLDILRNSTFDFAVVDMRLPGIDGNTFIRKAKKKRPDMNIIIHTGSTFYTLPKELRDMGITDDHILLKPLPDMEILSRTILKLRLET